MRMIAHWLLLAAVPGSLWASESQLEELNIKEMRPGYCYASSQPDTTVAGGFWQSDNIPQKLVDQQMGREGELSLVALPTVAVPFEEKHRGMRLLLINRTANEATFFATDSLLNIIQEARNSEGQWQPIEYIPGSWCGNSYHQVLLPAAHYWEFAAPVYSGSIKTKLRFALRQETVLYSNEFDGRVNPEQFIREEQAPQGLGRTPLD